MQYSTISEIRDMGYDKNVSVAEIDSFVDSRIEFLRLIQAEDPSVNFDRDIFDLEDARQKALLNKYCLTVQPSDY